MKFINPYYFLIAYLLFSFIEKPHSVAEARELAHKEHKFILVNFSGSDWCGPCILMDKEIFKTHSFKIFADSTLIIINADFPRKKKNQLSVKQQELNNAMAETYNPRGIFPFTTLLNENGEILKTWEGFPNISAYQFISQIKYEMYAKK